MRRIQKSTTLRNFKTLPHFLIKTLLWHFVNGRNLVFSQNDLAHHMHKDGLTVSAGIFVNESQVERTHRVLQPELPHNVCLIIQLFKGIPWVHQPQQNAGPG